jgi:hypothetical protein
MVQLEHLLLVTGESVPQLAAVYKLGANSAPGYPSPCGLT